MYESILLTVVDCAGLIGGKILQEQDTFLKSQWIETNWKRKIVIASISIVA